MRHRKSRHHLGRPADQRKAVLRTLATEFLRHGEIITTLAKAKALRPEVEKLITKGKEYSYLSRWLGACMFLTTGSIYTQLHIHGKKTEVSCRFLGSVVSRT